MTSIKDSAKAYVPPTTLNIVDLDKVSVNMDLKNKVVREGEVDEFNYDFIEVDDKEYRVPTSVKKQLKAILESKPELEFFKVTKTGEGLKTEYQVITL